MRDLISPERSIEQPRGVFILASLHSSNDEKGTWAIEPLSLRVMSLTIAPVMLS